MEVLERLYGACSCGRNQYEILPIGLSTARVLFDDSLESRLAGGALLPALHLRVPLAALRSTTYAFFPDEAHADIRRAFIPRHEPRCKRHFCGYCGTPLSLWTEAEPAESDYIRVPLGGLERESVEALEDLGILPSADDEEEEEVEGENKDEGNNERKQVQGAASVRTDGNGGKAALAPQSDDSITTGKPWAEEVIEGSALGRMRRRRGGNTSRDGKVKVEWEIIELHEEGVGESGEPSGNGKRKVGEMVGDDVMEEGRQ